MKSIKSVLLIILLSTFIFIGCKKDDPDSVACDVVKDNLPLAGNQEVPANTSTAMGKLNVSFDTCNNLLRFTITWMELSGNPVGAHIHGTASMGVNASVKYDFSAAIPKVTSGTFTDTVLVDNVALIKASLLQDMYYVNIHTATYPGGEIRGQIDF